MCSAASATCVHCGAELDLPEVKSDQSGKTHRTPAACPGTNTTDFAAIVQKQDFRYFKDFVVVVVFNPRMLKEKAGKSSSLYNIAR